MPPKEGAKTTRSRVGAKNVSHRKRRAPMENPGFPVQQGLSLQLGPAKVAR
jgi:hypothetical protein